jgi:hypothetical protein
MSVHTCTYTGNKSCNTKRFGVSIIVSDAVGKPACIVAADVSWLEDLGDWMGKKSWGVIVASIFLCILASCVSV